MSNLVAVGGVSNGIFCKWYDWNDGTEKKLLAFFYPAGCGLPRPISSGRDIIKVRNEQPAG